jgi:rhamnosyltransferase
MDKLSIIIRSYNEQKYIGYLLDLIFKQIYPEDLIEVVIIDSGSTDNTLDIIKNYPIKLVKIKPQEFTFGYSLNKGIEVASGDFLVLVSAHCLPVDNNWLKNLVEPFNDEKIALVYGKQRGKDTTKFSEHRIFESWFPEIEEIKQKNPFCNNANSAIRKSLWDKYHYDESLTGLEDLDWASNMFENGYTIVYQPYATVYHIHDETYTQVFRRYEREAIALKKIYGDIKFTLGDFLVLAGTNILTDIAAAISKRQFLKSIASIIRFRFSQFWGTYKGHNYKKIVSLDLKKKFYYPQKQIKVNNELDYILPIRFFRSIKRLLIK